MTIVETLLVAYARSFPLQKGKLRVVNAASRRCSRDGNTKRTARLIHGGYEVPVDLRFFLQRQLYFFGDYWVERELIRRWKRYAQNATTIFDVGANLGIYSLAAASVNPQASIHAFEPTPAICRALEQIVLMNRIANVAAHELAVLQSVGDVSLHQCDGGDANDGMNFVSRSLASATRGRRVVHGTSIDCFCTERKIERIDLLKMDVQGSEYEVLAGARRMIEERRVPVIFSELNWQTSNGGGVAERVVAELASRSYSFSAPLSGWMPKRAGRWLYKCSDVIATLEPTVK
jgi:FkbM family methyltransferase